MVLRGCDRSPVAEFAWMQDSKKQNKRSVAFADRRGCDQKVKRARLLGKVAFDRTGFKSAY